MKPNVYILFILILKTCISSFFFFFFFFFCLADLGLNEESREWLEKNARKEGVTTLPSGLQFRVLQTGQGKFHPTEFSYCTIHYRAMFMNETVFATSYAPNSPLTFRLPDGLQSWTQVLPDMVEGDVWELYNLSELGSATHIFPSNKVKAGDAVIFQLELVKITAEKRPADRCNIEDTNGCDESEKQMIMKYGHDVYRISKEMERVHVLVEESFMKEEIRDKLAAKVAFLSKLKNWILHDAKNEL